MPQDYLLCFYLTELKENKTLPNEVEKSFKNQMNTKDFSIHNLLLQYSLTEAGWKEMFSKVLSRKNVMISV